MRQLPKPNWRKLWRGQHRRAFKVATTLPAAHLNAVQYPLAARIGGAAGMAIPDDWCRPSLRQKLLNLLKSLRK